MNRALALTLLVCLLLVQGCRPGMRSALVGRWEGQADTLADYMARNAATLQIAGEEQANGDDAVGTAASGETLDAVPARDDSSQTSGPLSTDLEKFDFRIVLDLRSDGTVEMWRDEGVERLSGTWEVLSAAGRKATLHIAATPGDAEDAAVHRRFQIELDTDGQGFTLTEVGADSRFGWVHFRRLEE